jgi:hypothetical protein
VVLSASQEILSPCNRGALKFRKEDLDQFIESQRYMPLVARDVHSFVGLGEDNGKTILQKK